MPPILASFNLILQGEVARGKPRRRGLPTLLPGLPSPAFPLALPLQPPSLTHRLDEGDLFQVYTHELCVAGIISLDDSR